jgi:UDP-N-acetyl-D-mannosaminuronate dehydrogenase
LSPAFHRHGAGIAGAARRAEKHLGILSKNYGRDRPSRHVAEGFGFKPNNQRVTKPRRLPCRRTGFAGRSTRPTCSNVLPRLAGGVLSPGRLPTAVLIASRGIHVLGIDINEDVVRKISSGAVHIYEPDLDGLVQKVISTGTLTVSMRPAPSDAFIIAVPTPHQRREGAGPRFRFHRSPGFAPLLQVGNLVLLESTSPVGTTEKISELLADMRPDLSFPTRAGSAATVNVAYCPERVLPGRILSELVQNDCCIGGISPACARRAQRFYKHYVRGACIVSPARTAELVKLAENAFRDTNIAFANELPMLRQARSQCVGILSIWRIGILG